VGDGAKLVRGGRDAGGGWFRGERGISKNIKKEQEGAPGCKGGREQGGWVVVGDGVVDGRDIPLIIVRPSIMKIMIFVEAEL
jgi:hypothetical protein